MWPLYRLAHDCSVQSRSLEGSCLLEKTHQSNGNLRKNDTILMPKGEFKLAPNPNLTRLGAGRGGGGARVCVVNKA